jgi:hypothetical protein
MKPSREVITEEGSREGFKQKRYTAPARKSPRKRQERKIRGSLHFHWEDCQSSSRLLVLLSKFDSRLPSFAVSSYSLKIIAFAKHEIESLSMRIWYLYLISEARWRLSVRCKYFLYAATVPKQNPPTPCTKQFQLL